VVSFHRTEKWTLRCPRQSGFNLVELMVAITIITILTVHATTTFQNVSKTALVYSQAKALAKQVASLREARGRGTQTLEEAAVYDPWIDFVGPCHITGHVGASTGAPYSASCRNAADAPWIRIGMNKAPRTPWGDPFFLDANDEQPWWVAATGGGNMTDWILFYIPHRKRFGAVDVNTLRTPAITYKQWTGFE
jgi:prepilin-type N-terminal cleavage/methylation domain-containing protein